MFLFFSWQLRTHLGHIQKHQNQQTSINLNNPDSQAMHLETRLVQLDSAISMELWQVGEPLILLFDILAVSFSTIFKEANNKKIISIKKCHAFSFWGVLWSSG